MALEQHRQGHHVDTLEYRRIDVARRRSDHGETARTYRIPGPVVMYLSVQAPGPSGHVLS